MKKHTLLSFVFALSLMAATGVNAQTTGTDPQKITVTVAGNGTIGYTGDSGPAKKASLKAPNDVCMDAAHNLYFSDQTYTRIRKVASGTGVISTLAGGGSSTADGIAATDADIYVASMCADAAGNVYFVSGATNKIRKIDAATNVISTVAGAGSSTADGVPAVTASLTGVNSVCSDVSGNLYMTVGNKVRKINMATGIITTIAGTGASGYTGDGGPAISAALSLPMYIAADHAGNIYFGDQSAGTSFSDYVRRIDAVTGVITTAFGGGGTLFDCIGSGCMIGGLSGLCCDGDGDVVFNEWSCSCRKWNHTSNWVTLVGGNFSMEAFANDTSSAYAYMDHNYGICSDEANNYYVADRGNNRIRRIIQLTSTPIFAFGEAQTMRYCSAANSPINDMLWITDKDAGQTETWTVVTPPAHGTLGGFPATAISNGLTETTKPTGLTYVPTASYTGPDVFVVKVMDGALSNTISIHVQVLPVASVGGPSDVCLGGSATMAPTVPGGVWAVSNPNASISTSGVVTGLAAGTDNVLYTIDAGCGLSTINKPISIVTVVEPAGIAGADHVCAGSSTTLACLTPGGVWHASNGSAGISTFGTVIGMYAGTDTIYYSLTTACGTATTATVINILGMPDAGTITGSNNVCTQATITLTNAAASGVGTWVPTNSNATIDAGGVVYGVHAGLDTMIYRVVNTCGTADAQKIVAVQDCSVPSDLPLISGAPSIRVYPNPASAILNINTAGLTTGTSSINITDVSGRVVLTGELANNAAVKGLNISALNNGVYMLTITGNDVHFIEKVVVCR